jgi:hypothetical protein
MGKIIELNPHRQQPVTCCPEDLFALRWRIRLVSGLQVLGPWLPETRYPSLTYTLRDWAGKIDVVYIDGRPRGPGTSMTFVTCPGGAFKGLAYKAFALVGATRVIAGGIELEDERGQRYLVTRDGNVNHSAAEQANVANDH